MIKQTTLLTIFLMLYGTSSYATPSTAYRICPTLSDADERLQCFDSYVSDSSSVDELEVRALSPSQAAPLVELPVRENGRPYSLLPIAKLTSDDPNFFGVSSSAGDTNRGVETHAEFNISIKYPLAESLLGIANEWAGEKSGYVPDRFYVIYNGSYDFQMFTESKLYDSSPVISKTQNPGAVFEWDRAGGRQRFRAGIFHHSNGQSLDGDTPQEIAEVSDLIAAGNIEPALERVSRSSWYGQLRYQWMSNTSGDVGNDWWQYQMEIRPFYTAVDDEIFWNPMPAEQPNLERYDGIRFMGERVLSLAPLGKAFENISTLARVELQTGLWDPTKNVGGKLSFGVKWGSLLLSTYYYNGFAKDISSYHERTRHLGFGLELR